MLQGRVHQVADYVKEMLRKVEVPAEGWKMVLDENGVLFKPLLNAVSMDSGPLTSMLRADVTQWVKVHNSKFLAPQAANSLKHNCKEAGCVGFLGGATCPKAKGGAKQVVGQKPVALMEYLVQKHTTHPGQLVIDPFMGSGTTGIGALACRAGFIGVEKDPVTFFSAVHNIARAMVTHGATARGIMG